MNTELKLTAKQKEVKAKIDWQNELAKRVADKNCSCWIRVEKDGKRWLFCKAGCPIHDKN